MSNFAAYFAIENKLQQQGFDLSRTEVVKTFTKSKKSGLTELSPFEYRELLRWMNATFANPNETVGDRAKKCDQMRKKIIAILCKMGYKTPQGKADMARIKAWATKYGSSHRTFNAYSYKELTELVTQAEEMYNKFLTAI
jgi:hypothetical protein